MLCSLLKRLSDEANINGFSFAFELTTAPDGRPQENFWERAWRNALGSVWEMVGSWLVNGYYVIKCHAK